MTELTWDELNADEKTVMLDAYAQRELFSLYNKAQYDYPVLKPYMRLLECGLLARHLLKSGRYPIYGVEITQKGRGFVEDAQARRAFRLETPHGAVDIQGDLNMSAEDFETIRQMIEIVMFERCTFLAQNNLH